ncbi:MAG: hypothetical protein LBT38_03995 [Deltaproteobacteria bacterium]|jgi:hypothetical protein|nr:hypothetical protein [Deltaproteobacteria bacterium]
MDQAKPDQIGASNLADLIDQVRTGLQSFITTVKNCALYPENNQIRQESINKTYQWLASFLDEQESLKLFVDLNSLIYFGQPVHQDRPGEQNIIFPLFRDGVQWIEFLEGVTAKEMVTFIDLLNRFRMAREEDEDDLVTAMWGADFQSVKYKTANEFWDIDPITEITALKVINAPGQGQGGQGLEGGPGTGGEISQDPTQATTLRALFQWMELNAGSIGQKLDPNDKRLPSHPPNQPSLNAGQPLESRLWQLTEPEKKALSQLVAQNAQRTVADGLEPAIMVLNNVKSPTGRAPILEYLAESVRFSLAWSELRSLVTIIKSLLSLAQSKPDIYGDLPQVFQSYLHREEILDGFISLTPPGEGLTQADQTRLRTFLDFMPTKTVAIDSLIKLYPKVTDRSVKREILTAIANKAAAVGADLAPSININFPTQTVIQLIDRIPVTETDQSIPLLIGLSRNVNPSVREKAAQILLTNNPERIASLPHLLAESDPVVSSQIYSIISQKRSPAVERAILSFLQNSYELNQPRPEFAIYNAYRALGRAAATTKAAEFAGQVLLKKDLKALFGLGENQNHRQGAALALALTPEALGQPNELLAQASHSFFRAIRRAYQAASDGLSRNSG